MVPVLGVPGHIPCNCLCHYRKTRIKPGLEPRCPGPNLVLKSFSFLTPLVLFLKGTHVLTIFPQGFRHSQISDGDENASRDHVFNPELAIAHCFKQFKQKDFHLPRSRRRIIILPQKKDATTVDPTPQPQAPSQITQITPSFKAPEARDIQEPPEDVRTWMSQRLKFRQELESFGNINKWLRNKSILTPSESKILHMTHKEHPVAPLMAHFIPTGPTKVSSPICQMRV